MVGNSTLRVGIVVDETKVSKYVRDLIWFLQSQPNLALSVFIVPRKAAAPPVRFPNRRRIQAYFSGLVFRVIVAGEALVLRRSCRYRDHLMSYDIADLAPGAETIRCGGVAERETPENPRIDLLLDFGSGDDADEVAIATSAPILRIVYGREDIAARGPPGFWECYDKHDSTEFRIEMRNGGSDHVHVLRQGTFGTQFLYSLNRVHICAKAYTHLQQVIVALVANRHPSAEPRRCDLAPARGQAVPAWPYSLGYLAKACFRAARKACFHLIRLRQRWNLTVFPENWINVPYWKGLPVAPPPGAYWADPFLFRSSDRTYCFAEEFVFKTRRGHIAAFELRNGRPVEPRQALAEDAHLSFPFIFEYGGDVFMCPECSEMREIRIYRCVDLPSRWELAKIAMRDIPAADTMIFPHQGRWWMLTNIDYSGIDDYCSELYVFSAESPLSDDWRPHPLNPVKINCRGGRNGGLLFERGRIFRVGQRQGFDRYGKGILIHEINVLTEEAYEERPAWQIDADFRKHLLGVHHLSSRNGITVIDHANWSFVR